MVKFGGLYRVLSMSAAAALAASAQAYADVELNTSANKVPHQVAVVTGVPHAQEPAAVQNTAQNPVRNADEKPLMIIRFNAAYVHYQNTLILAVSKAKEANPNVRFNLVSYEPAGATPAQAQRITEKAKTNLATLAEDIHALGIATSQIAYALQTDSSLAYQEIHIFVE